MTMERSNSKEPKIKQKKSISKLLMPSKTPNKVGVEPVRSPSMRTKERNIKYDSAEEIEPPRSPLMVSKRPLSLDVQSLNSLKNENYLDDEDVSSIFLSLTLLGGKEVLFST